MGHTLPVLEIIKEAQLKHGLIKKADDNHKLYNNYQLYRAYCSRRLQRLRKQLNPVQKQDNLKKNKQQEAPSNRKETLNKNNFGQKKNERNFKKKQVTVDNVNDHLKYAHVPLMEAERAWAHSVQLGKESGMEQSSRKKFHSISRLRKAVQHAAHLQSICQSSHLTDTRTKLEVRAYSLCMHGTLCVKLEDWKSARDKLSSSRTIYDKLASVATEAKYYRSKVEELEQKVRFCDHNLASCREGLPEMNQGCQADFDRLISEAGQENGLVTWRGRPVAVGPQKVRLFLAAAQEFQMSRKSHNLTAYEAMLLECRKIVQWLKTKRVPIHPKLIDYLTYLRITLTIDANLIRIHSCKNSTRPVKFYQKIIQLLAELLTLITSDPISDQLEKDIDLLDKHFRAFHSYHTALTCQKLGKLPEALALYKRADSCVTYCGSRVLASAEMLPRFANLGQELSDLRDSIRRAQCQLAQKTNVLTDDLVSAMDGLELVDELHDLALHHVTFPSLDANMPQVGGSRVAGLLRTIWAWGAQKK